jgi:hypothetical protein
MYPKARITRRYGVYLSPGAYRLIPYEDTTDWAVFHGALSLKNFADRHGITLRRMQNAA